MKLSELTSVTYRPIIICKPNGFPILRKDILRFPNDIPKKYLDREIMEINPCNGHFQVFLYDNH